MPYRRLPNTDSARIRALDTAIETEYIFPMGELALSYRIINEAKSFVEEFRRIHTFYQQSFAEQVKASRKFQEQTRMARMYISRHPAAVPSLRTSDGSSRCANTVATSRSDRTCPRTSARQARMKECFTGRF